MNRQERRRQTREGKKQRPWDLIITAGVAGAIVIILAFVYMFPNLNLATFEKASPRIMNKAVSRSINWLVEDEPGFVKFNFGYLADPEENEWVSYLVERSENMIKFTDLESKAVQEIGDGTALPVFYRPLSDAIDELKTALKNREFELKFQQATGEYNVFTLTKETGDGDNLVSDQYVLALDAKYHIDYLAHVSGKDEDTVGYNFSNLYSPAEVEAEETTTP